MTADFMRSLKGAVQTWLLELQQEQIWMDSIGSDGIPFGYYAKNGKNPTRQSPRSKGQKYEMDDTGELFENMKVVIEVGKREIHFVNRRTNVEIFKQDKNIFFTDQWFGLTEEHFGLFLNNYCYRWVLLWTKNRIRYGANAKTYGFDKPK